MKGNKKMNVNGLIDKSLEKQNISYHESSSCESASPDTPVKNARWCKISSLGDEGLGIPVYRRDDDVLLLPLTHTLVTGSSGTGKSEVFYKNFINILTRVEDKSKPSLLITDLKGDARIVFGQHTSVVDEHRFTPFFDD